MCKNTIINLRNEYFGCILYHNILKKYIYGDSLIRDLIQNHNILYDNNYVGILKEKYSISDDVIEELLDSLKHLDIDYDCINEINDQYPKSHLFAPLRVFFDYTFACNLSCKHCFTESGEKKNNELTFEQKKTIIDQMVSMGTFRLSIAGGEPLVAPTFPQFIEYAQSRNIDLSFTTNGVLLNKKKIDELNQLKPMLITISLDGANEKTHDYIRGNGMFRLVLNNLKLMQRYYKGSFAIKMTLMSINFNQISEFVKLGEDIGCDIVKFNAIRPTGRVLQNLELLLTQDQYISAIEQGATLQSNKVKIVLPLNPFSNEDCDYIEDLGFGCVIGKDCMTVFPTGEIKACSQLSEEFVDGNCKEQTLKEVWDTGKYFNYFRKLKGNKICIKCEIYDKCRAGCRYRAFKENNFDSIDPFCFLRKNIRS